MGSRLVYINPDFVPFLVYMSRLAPIKPPTVNRKNTRVYLYPDLSKDAFLNLLARQDPPHPLDLVFPGVHCLTLPQPVQLLPSPCFIRTGWIFLCSSFIDPNKITKENFGSYYLPQKGYRYVS